MNLSIIYLTNRKQPHIEWFFPSLHRELNGNYTGIQVVVVDFWANSEGRREQFRNLAKCKFDHISPKPSPWQGTHRTIDHNAFAASNARNTGIAVAQHPYVVFVDDVSVLVNGWLNGVKEGQKHNRIVCGAYRKVHELKVDGEGNIVHWLPFKNGNDVRWQEGRTEAAQCPANWLFGCSFAAPLETLLAVNGLDESNDGMGFEDVCLGMRLALAGNAFWYDQRMLTFESEEAHHNPEDISFRRHNRPIEGFQDLAWFMLDYVKTNARSLGTPDLRELRAHLAKCDELGSAGSGGVFPLHNGPHIFPDGKDLIGRQKQ